METSDTIAGYDCDQSNKSVTSYSMIAGMRATTLSPWLQDLYAVDMFAIRLKILQSRNIRITNNNEDPAHLQSSRNSYEKDPVAIGKQIDSIHSHIAHP